MSVVVSCRLPDEIAERLDAQLEKAGLKNRSQAIGVALLTWLREREGGQSAEDRLVERIEQVIRKELAKAQVSGAGTQKGTDPAPVDKMARFLAAGKH